MSITSISGLKMGGVACGEGITGPYAKDFASGVRATFARSPLMMYRINPCCGSTHGHAWWYRCYAPGNGRQAGLERKARDAKRRRWADPNPVPPWEWRTREW